MHEVISGFVATTNDYIETSAGVFNDERNNFAVRFNTRKPANARLSSNGYCASATAFVKVDDFGSKCNAWRS